MVPRTCSCPGGSPVVVLVRPQLGVNIGAAGVSVGSLNLEAGTGPAGGTLASFQSDAGILSSGALNVHVLGNLDMTGGETSILLGANPITSASALVNLQGANVLLNVQGNVVLKAGKATAVAGGNTANSSAAIVATAAFDPASRIFGNLTIQGGVAIAEPIGGQVGNAQSTSKLQTAGNLDLTVQGNLSVLGGTANATASSGSRNIITTSTSR